MPSTSQMLADVIGDDLELAEFADGLTNIGDMFARAEWAADRLVGFAAGRQGHAVAVSFAPGDDTRYELWIVDRGAPSLLDGDLSAGPVTERALVTLANDRGSCCTLDLIRPAHWSYLTEKLGRGSTWTGHVLELFFRALAIEYRARVGIAPGGGE